MRAYGAIGDKGCDGHVLSTGRVFQCYGSLGGQESKVSYLISKMGDDFDTARKLIPQIMKEWHMVHNFVDGLPIPAAEKLAELAEKIKIANSALGFEERVFSLDQKKIEDLLGIVPTSLDAQNMQPLNFATLSRLSYLD